MDIITGRVLAEGKTKVIVEDRNDPTQVFIISKDDITAGDGAKHDVIVGKAALSTKTTSNVFRLLKFRGIPVAFKGEIGEVAFSAHFCLMLLYEVVVRRKAYGSYLDRHPECEKGQVFEDLVLEFFLKTSGKVWRGVRSGKEYKLLKDDPLMEIDWEKGEVSLFYPGHSAEERKTAAKDALLNQKPFLTLPLNEVFDCEDEKNRLQRMGEIAKQTFLILEEAWSMWKYCLVDFKVEFGLDSDGNVRLADVIDSDSWRLINEAGEHDDKQYYRENGDLNEVTAKYRRIAYLTDQFLSQS
jgi:phosphoribosylaminoimidazole-succinocarboxamide synthase